MNGALFCFWGAFVRIEVYSFGRSSLNSAAVHTLVLSLCTAGSRKDL